MSWLKTGYERTRQAADGGEHVRGVGRVIIPKLMRAQQLAFDWSQSYHRVLIY